MTITDHINDCSEAQNKLTKFIDDVLDFYDPDCKDLLKRIVDLREEFETLEKEFEEFR